MPASTPRNARFATTRWSLVVAAGRAATPHSREALGELCVLYWEPVYCYLRRRGHHPEAAMDITQGFFARLLEKAGVATADPARGRFRSFLLGAVNHFIANEENKERAQKRGGGAAILSLDAEAAEEHYRHEPVEARTPESIFLRAWAERLLDHTRAALRDQYEGEGKGALFHALEGSLTGERSEPRYRALGESLGMSEAAVKVAVHRLRRRYRDALRTQVAATVESDTEVEDEIRFLIQQLSG